MDGYGRLLHNAGSIENTEWGSELYREIIHRVPTVWKHNMKRGGRDIGKGDSADLIALGCRC